MTTARVRPSTPAGEQFGTVLELTTAQLGIWNAQRLEPDSRDYLVGDVLEISGPARIDVELLAEAIRITTDEAETLRLRVFDTPDGPRQTIGEPADSPEIVDLRAERDPVAAAHRLVEAERLRVAEACRGMVDRRLYSRTIIRLSDREVWYTQLGHHLIFDGYTAAMLARRTAALYTALVRGSTAAPSTFGRFAELVESDRAYLASEQFARDRAYWRDQLTPLPDLGEWGQLAVGPPDRTLTARAVMPPEEVARLRAVADEAGTTWGEVLIACYAAFLHRVRGESDVVFALPLMCRIGSVALRTPAMAVNVLPLRVTVRSGERLPELSRRVAAVMRDMRVHQRYRGENLPQDLAVPGAGALLHGRGVNLKAFDLAIDFAGATGVMRNVAGGPPEDVGLTALPTADGGLLLGFEVDARTDSQAGVDRRLDVLRRLITALTGPGSPAIGQTELVEPDEQERLLADWAVPALPGRPQDVPTALTELVAAHPAQTALVHGADRLSTAEVGRRVHRLARALRARGIGPDDVVALGLPRSADLVIALLAVLDAGAAYLSLDLQHPVDRLRELVDDARPALLLTTQARVGDLPGVVEALDSPALRAELAALSGEPLTGADLAAPRDPEHLAYVIYTSGSTGRPKGVLGRVGGLAGLLHHQRSTIVAESVRTTGRRLRTAHTYSFAFDAPSTSCCGCSAGTRCTSTTSSSPATPRHCSRRTPGTGSMSSTPPRRWLPPLVRGGSADRRAPAVPAGARRGGHAAGAVAAG